MTTSPRIYLLSRPIFTDMHRKFLHDILSSKDAFWIQSEDATDAERLVEFAGRVCYMSFGTAQHSTSNYDYIRALIRNGHDSVLEHAVWTFALSAVSRAFTHQMVRHRVGFSYSQLSQQYHDETEARFVRPIELNASPEAAAIWDRTMQQSREAYKKMLFLLTNAPLAPPGKESTRALRSAARSVLPNATETTIVITANARAIRHFLELRGGIVGDSEMRAVSALLFETLRPEAPALFSDFVVEHPGDGLPLIRRVPI